jgi:hypothetical protein
MTVDSGAFEAIWRSDRPLVLDADGLNWLAQQPPELRQSRPAPTLVTPHAGEFRRLFPDQDLSPDAIAAATAAAQATGWTVVLKGARTAIAPTPGHDLDQPRQHPSPSARGQRRCVDGAGRGLGGPAHPRTEMSAGEGLLGGGVGRGVVARPNGTGDRPTATQF